ncbi:LOW QUALITY PROTEIN: reverse transcriptase [Phytophthora megakarya]|uniref:Reverse transcriptase n=1 Tax=Phytophthora megakarya TaxID=4795 RepID=A0A225WFN7_9STRA|nr:LOW QUALITY PROTEIN: reverse transcriptase [Phytophthora megakarya]
MLKRNGVDIRMCNDYRLLNLLSKLSCYSLPLIDDLLVDFESAMWFKRLDMASGFWAVRMTERVKLLCVRLPVRVINNCLWGFVRLPPEDEAKVDPEVLKFLNLKSQESLDMKGKREELRDSVENLEVPPLELTVFRCNIPAPSQMGPVLGRSSYPDDIAHGASTWYQLCEDLGALLYRLRYWNTSVSLPKSEFGKSTIPFLSHEVSSDGLPIVAAVLYELDEERVRAGRNVEAAKKSFEILKRTIVSTLLLRHPDRTKPFVTIPHANTWSACAVLGQEHDGLVHPVRFTGRVLKKSKLSYHITEKEVLAILRTLGSVQTPDLLYRIPGDSVYPVFRIEVVARVLRRGWATSKMGFRIKWTLEIHRIRKDVGGLAAILGSGITPREHSAEVAETLIPAEGRLQGMPPGSLEILDADYQGYILSVDGTAKVSTRQGSCECIQWKLPGWQVVKAE